MRRLRISGYRRAAVSRSRGYARSRFRRRGSRPPDGQGYRAEHEDRGDEERHSREGRRGVRTDEPGEDQREQDRTDDARQARDARVGALQLPLLRRTDAARHETLQRRLDKADRREHDDRQEEDIRSGGETPYDERGDSGDQARDQRLPLSEALDETLHEAPLDRDVQRSHDRERRPHLHRAPAVPVARVDDVDTREDLEGEELDEVDRGETEEVPVGAEEAERPDGVRAPQRESPPVLRGERLRQDEDRIRRADQRERGGGPERQPDSERADDASDRWTEDESDAPGRADHPERRRTSLGRRDVRDIGGGRRVARCGDAGQDAAQEEPRQIRRERHDHVVDAEPETREDQDRTATEAVRQCPDERREQELHQAPDRHEEPEDLCSLRGVTREAHDQPRQDGYCDAEAEGVEDDRHVDEGQRGLASADGGRGLAATVQGRPDTGRRL